MGVHNGQQHVTAAIESVLAQTFTAFELLIVDDRSTDQTPGMLAQWAKRDARVRVVRQEHAGLTAALNRARALPRGEYLARQDADDLSRPDRFASQVDYLDAHPAIAVVGTAVELLNEAEVIGGHTMADSVATPVRCAALGESGSRVAGREILFHNKP